MKYFMEKVISWFESYLSGRNFKINIVKKFSYFQRSSRIYIRSILFFLYVNDMPQVVRCGLFLYADDTCLTFQHEDVKKIEAQLNLNFSSLCDWFSNNKLSIHLEEDKTRSILFGTKINIKWSDH